ncbi:MAG: RIP metalloprotease RseP [Nitrospirota bacterium]|nr:RIP metalloprotease RseP [Nitrospirota bacterium]
MGILIFVHELGHFLVAKFSGVKVLKFSLGFGPKVIGKQIGETEYMLSAVPLGGYVKMLGEEAGEELDEADKARAFNQQSVTKRILIVLAGPVFNIFLTYIIFTAVLSTGLPVNVPVLSNILPVIDEVQEGYPASEAGLKAGDVIVKIDSKRIDTWFDMVNIVVKNPGKKLDFVVKRDGKLLDLKIVPQSVEEVDPGGKKVVIGRIGVKKLGGGFFESIQSDSVLEAPVKGVTATYKMGFFVVDSIKMLITRQVSLKNISGPVTILQESGKAASAGLLTYFMFMALLSVNLGVLNLLPVPILDGGHIVMFVIEGIKGKPLSERTIAVTQKIGLALLLLLMAFALYNDFVRIFTGSSTP